jgi:hypothetical protein
LQAKLAQDAADGNHPNVYASQSYPPPVCLNPRYNDYPHLFDVTLNENDSCLLERSEELGSRNWSLENALPMVSSDQN